MAVPEFYPHDRLGATTSETCASCGGTYTFSGMGPSAMVTIPASHRKVVIMEGMELDVCPGRGDPESIPQVVADPPWRMPDERP